LGEEDCRGALQHIDAALAYWRTSTLLCLKADLHVRQGQYETALACCEEVLRNYPSNEKAHFFRGLAYKHLGKQREALESLRQAEMHGEPRAADEMRRLTIRGEGAGKGRPGGG
jgi:tetratricopeptide (TPR) repeat protein